jgi:hypothetical protein
MARRSVPIRRLFPPIGSVQSGRLSAEVMVQKEWGRFGALLHASAWRDSMRCLVIEDEADTARYICNGLTVAWARNGADGLHLATLWHSHILLRCFLWTPLFPSSPGLSRGPNSGRCRICLKQTLGSLHDVGGRDKPGLLATVIYVGEMCECHSPMGQRGRRWSTRPEFFISYWWFRPQRSPPFTDRAAPLRPRSGRGGLPRRFWRGPAHRRGRHGAGRRSRSARPAGW